MSAEIPEPEAFATSEPLAEGDNAPPTPENWDYAEIGLLTLLFLIGAPLNLVSLVRSLNASYGHNMIRRTSSNTRSALMTHIILDATPSGPSKPFQASRQTTLRLHLTIANLITVWVYGLSEIFWLITYSWKGGDMLCRVIQFCYTFCFYATSNLTASIAVDRMCASIYGKKRRPSFLRYLRLSVWISWALAFVSSIPQLFVWRTFSPFSDQWPDWSQCVSVWVIAKHQADVAHELNDTSGGAVDLMELQETIYNGFHLALVFWIPAIVIVGSYVVIVTRLQLTIKETQEEMARRCRLQRASNAAMFRQHAGYLHRLGAIGSGGDAGYLARTRVHTQRRSRTSGTSPALLMELPIVIKSPQAFVCQPLLESFALMTLVRAKWRTVRKTAYILLAYILCWSPYNVLALGRYIDPSFENGYLEVLSNLIVLNAVINPLIYGI